MNHFVYKNNFKQFWKTSITEGNDEEKQAIDVAQQIYDEHPKGADWGKIVRKILLALVAGLGISFAIAMRAASKVQKH